ncbi:hypothetical protein [Fulvitalea axinellae]
MIRTQTNLFRALLIILLLWGCSDSDDPLDKEHPENREYSFVRLLISNADNSNLLFYTPSTQDLEAFDIKHPKGSLYASSSGRYALITHRDHNYVETFDSSIEAHGDHAHLSDAKVGGMYSNGNKPTHVKSKLGKFLVFNDGDGTLSIGRESKVGNSEEMRQIDLGLTAHHGAMAIFKNGNYAVTEKLGEPGGLPEQVILIDSDGKKIDGIEPIATPGIHGSASNDNTAVFGSISGVLIIHDNGQQEIISYPADFDKSWIGSLMSTYDANKFIGAVRGKGLYTVDVAAKSISPLVMYDNIVKMAVSSDKKKLGLLLQDGTLVYFDLEDKSEIFSEKVIDAIPEQQGHGHTSPNLTLSSKYAYISEPVKKELLHVYLAKPSEIKKQELQHVPYSLVLLGAELDNEGAH